MRSIRTTLLLTTILAVHASAATPLISVRVSPDITARVDPHVVPPNAALQDAAGSLSLEAPGMLAATANLDALHVDGDGGWLLSLDVGGVVDGLHVGHADVVRYDGSGYTLVFNAQAAGLPDGIDVDAVSRAAGAVVLSFDTAVALDGVSVADADLVAYDGSAFSLFFDASAAGVAEAADVDAAHVLADGRLLVSFETGGAIGGVTYDHADVLEHDPAARSWQIAYRATGLAGWAAADLDALSVVVDLDGDGVTDGSDNCQLHPNSDQRDTDGDGFGNRCDADFNGDCVVNAVDLGLLRAAFFGAGPDEDLDGDGVVNVVDLGIVRSLFFLPPGPSGLPGACGGA